MELKKLLRNEYLMGIVINILNLIVSILYSAMIARYLGPEIKGETAYISSVVGIASTALSFGMHQIYAYYRKEDDSIKDMYMTNIFVVFGVYSAIATAICLLYHSNITVVAIVILSVVAAYLRIVNYVYLVENSIKRNVIMLFVHVVQIFYVLILILWTRANLFWGITNLIFVDLVLSVIYTAKLRVKIDCKKVDIRFIFKTLKFGFIPMITILASKLNYKLDVLMLKAFPNVSLAEIGVYSIGLMLADKVLIIPETVKSILLSRLAKGKTAEEVARVMRMCFPICFVMIGGLALFGKPVINFIYGAQYENAYGITFITMFGVCALMFYNMIEIYNIVNKKQSITLTVLISSIVLNVIVNSLLIPRYASIGAAFATVISYTYCAVALLSCFSWQTKIKFKDLIIINRQDIKEIMKLIRKKKVK